MNRSPIRVLFVVPRLSVGGAERHVVTLLPALDRTRFNPALICIGDEGELFPDLPSAGVDALALNSAGARHIFRALWGLVSSMRRMQPDVVVLRGYNAEMLGRLAAIIAGVRKTIVWVHNIGDTQPRSSLRRFADRVLESRTSSYFGVANAQRSYLVEDLRHPEHKVRIIHNGIDPALFDPRDDRRALAEFGIEPGDPVVGIVAGLRPEKDHVTLLHAARLVVDELSGVKFLIIGDGSLRAELETLCRELVIDDNVIFAGTRHDIDRLLPGLDVFTLSSFTVECFPFSLLEAMACACPAVCTDVGGVGEIIDEGVTGYLVPPRDPQRLAARLCELLTNPPAARRMGLAGRIRVESLFSLRRSVDEAERAIEDVVFRGGRSVGG